jgi:DNA-binding transcriptional regulator LsrR (DeoR family)
LTSYDWSRCEVISFCWTSAHHQGIKPMTTRQLKRQLTSELMRLSDCFLQVDVHRSGDESNNLEDRLAEFASNAAADVGECLIEDGVKTVGVGWGYTVAVAIEMLQERGVPELSAGRSITFLPTCGEPERPIRPVNPSDLRNDQMSSTALAAALDRVFNRGLNHHLSLIGVPDFVGIGAPDAEVEIAKNCTIRQNADWTKIFDESSGEIGKLDAILTSVASPKQPNRQFVPIFEQATGVDENMLTRRVIADIGGAWIPRQDGDPVVTRWSNWWTGMTYSHYARCAERAAFESKPGVIVVAFGDNKAEVVMEVVKRGLVNTLIIDDSLAIELLVGLGHSRPPSAPLRASLRNNPVQALGETEVGEGTVSTAEGSCVTAHSHNASMRGPRNQAFISYSHTDKKWIEELQTWLRPMLADGAIRIWVDTEIAAGTNWLENIQAALAAAKVAVLLVTPAFLASEFITRHEIPSLLRAAKDEGIIIFWIPISDSNYQHTPIAEYQAAHPPEQPLDGITRPQRNRALVKICNKLKDAFLRPLPDRGGEQL